MTMFPVRCEFFLAGLKEDEEFPTFMGVVPRVDDLIQSKTSDLVVRVEQVIWKYVEDDWYAELSLGRPVIFDTDEDFYDWYYTKCRPS